MTSQTLDITMTEPLAARMYRKLATGRGASDIDHWIDQLAAGQARELYVYERSAAPASSVLRWICGQFISLTVGGRFTHEQLEEYYAAARERLAEKAEEL